MASRFCISILVVLTLFLSACGGSGGDSGAAPAAQVPLASTVPPTTPVANFQLHTLSVEGPFIVPSTTSGGYRYDLSARDIYPLYKACPNISGLILNSGKYCPISSAKYTLGTSSGIFDLEFQGIPKGVSVYPTGFPYTSSSPGSYKLSFSGNGEFLSSMSGENSFGYTAVQGLGARASRNPGANSIFKFVGDFDALKVPVGWEVDIKTHIIIILSSDWTDSSGRPVSANVPIYDKEISGPFSESIVLSGKLAEYPALQGEAGGYSISVATAISIRRSQ
jgi:hypothetical protein